MAPKQVNCAALPYLSPAMPPLQAMFVDFGMAVQYGGNCYLRFDDTNPEAEKQEYIDHIEVRACDACFVCVWGGGAMVAACKALLYVCCGHWRSRWGTPKW
jgi:hypothetical protein